ncbi:hypothetical protein A3D06_01745 [Candidatus Roizmanbacteria bacterium RIFCSPHIGHO2_02_FULL_40_9]|uniref:Sortase n=2 Tax=Candidatus Roizmaniibacteriota TaxID=1752723 RepID=A0A1F7IKX9_9BACT|nr:MAG: hypothetical protein A3D06_01745 [Candidatus Roizmanbacteria bacterium RIFCSPHIGHO2_02_FULL_40_9]OGK44038.1 MAG: hypothetical protein A2957_01730 [Candidatus Roizmanbacteria bacterium RIFCSPLOWO2_01_FULL_38_11]
MALYRYKKKIFGKKKRLLTVISYISMTAGALFLFWSFYPVIASEIYSQLFVESSVESPLPESQSAVSVQKANSIKGSQNKFSTNLVDYTKASNWFTNGERDIDRGIKARTDVREYTLDIPKLGIQGARVIVDGENLLDGLIQYRPEILPGQLGTVNVFGHSSIPQFFNVKNYKTIFTYIPTLDRGDIIYATVDGVKYKYEVYGRKVVEPNEVAVLESHYDDVYLQLITCVPLGSWAKRHIAQARLVELPQ